MSQLTDVCWDVLFCLRTMLTTKLRLVFLCVQAIPTQLQWQECARGLLIVQRDILLITSPNFVSRTALPLRLPMPKTTRWDAWEDALLVLLLTIPLTNVWQFVLPTLLTTVTSRNVWQLVQLVLMLMIQQGCVLHLIYAQIWPGETQPVRLVLPHVPSTSTPIREI